MSQQEFQNKVDGSLNDYINGAINEKEFRETICDILLEVAQPKLQPEPGILTEVSIYNEYKNDDYIIVGRWPGLAKKGYFIDSCLILANNPQISVELKENIIESVGYNVKSVELLHREGEFMQLVHLRP